MPYKIEHDRKGCIGCGACAAVCPENWEIEGNKAKPKKKTIGDEELECNKKAEEVCPVGVIKIVKTK